MEQKYSYIVFFSISAAFLYYFYKKKDDFDNCIDIDQYQYCEKKINKKKIRFNLIPYIYHVKSYKNLELWYNNYDYKLFKIYYFRNTDENNLQYNQVLDIHHKTLFF